MTYIPGPRRNGAYSNEIDGFGGNDALKGPREVWAPLIRGNLVGRTPGPGLSFVNQQRPE